MARPIWNPRCTLAEGTSNSAATISHQFAIVIPPVVEPIAGVESNGRRDHRKHHDVGLSIRGDPTEMIHPWNPSGRVEMTHAGKFPQNKVEYSSYTGPRTRFPRPRPRPRPTLPVSPPSLYPSPRPRPRPRPGSPPVTKDLGVWNDRAASLGAGLGAWKVPSTLGAPASTHWEGILYKRLQVSAVVL
ncbi:hypothetical protein PCH_Pc13g05970 [Penicillium rubens Wisconsin 54-1255]|uniref:Uncharacterized protein n=1 Tax=Penicillium rubens (strain ATCC 28089 / DSM 1075 / NRRL 1951 / Wisconsin 54-1255) TaxID=500485 RepID=B6H385_PENRW|nr:hypothetical protein PCH_Pc13g05970 [Penicillium rubens Wisconsin 54-1255]